VLRHPSKSPPLDNLASNIPVLTWSFFVFKCNMKCAYQGAGQTRHGHEPGQTLGIPLFLHISPFNLICILLGSSPSPGAASNSPLTNTLPVVAPVDIDMHTPVCRLCSQCSRSLVPGPGNQDIWQLPKDAEHDFSIHTY